MMEEELNAVKQQQKDAINLVVKRDNANDANELSDTYNTTTGTGSNTRSSLSYDDSTVNESSNEIELATETANKTNRKHLYKKIDSD